MAEATGANEEKEIETSLGLSDEEFLNKDHSAIFAEEDPENSEDTATDKEVTSKEEDSQTQEQTDSTDTTEEVTDAEDTQDPAETSGDTTETESSDTGDTDSTDTTGDTQETDEFDYESAFKKVSQPFKANGTEMTVKDPEDMVRLMQMGANYQKKMANLKPNLKIIKMLENNKLLDEKSISNLIDISKKNPQALAKLFKESGLDPQDFDPETSGDYVPADHSVSDNEINLDLVLDDIKESEHFDKTISVLTKNWDNNSKKIISDNPEFITVINAHMGNGVYDKVNAQMQQDKALGKLNGIPDVQAYQQTAESMLKDGLLGAKTPEKSDTTSEKTDKEKLAEAERIKKRKAVAPVKQTVPKKEVKTEPDFLNMSDEDFLKQQPK